VICQERDFIRKVLQKIVSRGVLDHSEIFDFLEGVKTGKVAEVQIGGFLVGLAMKGVTEEELATIAQWMRKNSIAVRPRVRSRLMDTCGTGGGILTFNVSTAVAILVAATGIPIAKHGSRSISHRSGSADVLEALGVNIDLTKEQAERLIEEVGFAFLYAPKFHPLMHKILGPESLLGIKTVFYTVIGPLINPADVKAHLLGVYRKDLVEPIARVLAKLGYVRALVVHGVDGLDEISNVGPTLIGDVENGRFKGIYEVTPEDMGVKRSHPSEIMPLVDDPLHNAEIIRGIFKGDVSGAKRDFLIVNAAGALVVGGLVKDLRDGVELAKKVLDEGRAHRKLLEIIEASHKVALNVES
jgi:anthranilate phosphoribosyltransferase